MRRIFVYEYLSGGGEPGGSAESSGTELRTDPQTESHSELLAAGLSMRDAVSADLLELDHCEVSVAACESTGPVPDGARAVVPRSGESALDFVARQADMHSHVWVIAPETGGVLAQLNRCVDPVRWLGCDGPAIELTSGKRNTLLRLAHAGITTPLAFEHAPEIVRWVVKPNDGAGAIDTRLHATEEAALEDWSSRSRAGSPVVVEPWIEGETLSLSLMCRDGQAELLSINRQHLTIDADGLLSYDGVDVDVTPVCGPRGAPLNALARAIGRAVAGLRGFVGVDVVWHVRCGPVAIEINPRVTCAYVGLSRVLDRNLGAETLRACGLRPSGHV